MCGTLFSSILDFEAYAPKSMLRWGAIKEKTGLSTRTLSLRLKQLQEKGLVRRIVDTAVDQYPPPVYYQRVGEAERKFDALVQKEWKRVSQKINKLFKLTFKDPEVYFELILEAIMLDAVFTLQYAANAPTIFEATLLLKHHNETHRRLMTKTCALVATSKRYRKALEHIYKNTRRELEERSKELTKVSKVKESK
jgi:DNA-binding Lrp family transcriptional regulator